MGRTDSLEKTLMLGKIEGGRRRRRQKMRWLGGITDSVTWVGVSFGSWWWMEAWHASVYGVTKSWTWLNNWTGSNNKSLHFTHRSQHFYDANEIRDPGLFFLVPLSCVISIPMVPPQPKVARAPTLSSDFYLARSVMGSRSGDKGYATVFCHKMGSHMAFSFLPFGKNSIRWQNPGVKEVRGWFNFSESLYLA